MNRSQFQRRRGLQMLARATGASAPPPATSSGAPSLALPPAQLLQPQQSPMPSARLDSSSGGARPLCMGPPASTPVHAPASRFDHTSPQVTPLPASVHATPSALPLPARTANGTPHPLAWGRWQVAPSPLPMQVTPLQQKPVHEPVSEDERQREEQRAGKAGEGEGQAPMGQPRKRKREEGEEEEGGKGDAREEKDVGDAGEGASEAAPPQDDLNCMEVDCGEGETTVPGLEDGTAGAEGAEGGAADAADGADGGALLLSPVLRASAGSPPSCVTVRAGRHTSRKRQRVMRRLVPQGEPEDGSGPEGQQEGSVSVLQRSGATRGGADGVMVGAVVAGAESDEGRRGTATAAVPAASVPAAAGDDATAAGCGETQPQAQAPAGASAGNNTGEGDKGVAARTAGTPRRSIYMSSPRPDDHEPAGASDEEEEEEEDGGAGLLLGPAAKCPRLVGPQTHGRGGYTNPAATANHARFGWLAPRYQQYGGGYHGMRGGTPGMRGAQLVGLSAMGGGLGAHGRMVGGGALNPNNAGSQDVEETDEGHVLFVPRHTVKHVSVKRVGGAVPHVFCCLVCVLCLFLHLRLLLPCAA